MSKKKTMCFLIVLMVILTTSATFGKIIYVDVDAKGANDGSNWENAHIFLQDALYEVRYTAEPVEIRVAQGTYKPDQGFGITSGNRISSFGLISGVSLEGGYAGVGAPDPNVRDIELFKTTLSGDLAGNDVTVYNAQDMAFDVTRAENSYHILTAYEIDPNASLDGFTIVGGNADDEQEEHVRGGGIYCDSSKLNIENCTFESNSCVRYGGAICNHRRSELVVTNCEFNRNAAHSGGAIDIGSNDNTFKYCAFTANYVDTYGGAIYKCGGEMQLTDCIFAYNSSHSGGGIYSSCSGGMRLFDCTFIGNYSESFGGGMYNRRGTTGQLLVGCTFKYNYATWYGGGIYNTIDCSPVIKNCLFTGNSTDEWGGALLFHGCNAEVINCTIADNYARKGGAICFGREDEILPSDVTITNSIIWNNFYEIYNNDYSWMRMTYCCRETAYSRVPEGCFSENPCFVMPGWDYHLKSQTGSYDADSKSWFIDDVTSPCIDAGDPTVSVGDEPEPNGGRINMGAYGGTAEASMSTHAEDILLPNIALIYYSDTGAAESYQFLLSAYGCPTTLLRMDIHAAVLLDEYDLVILASDTNYKSVWKDSPLIDDIENSGKPILGLGRGGSDFFGRLGLSIGESHGWIGDKNGIFVANLNHKIFSTPHPIDIPQDRMLELYTQTGHIGIYMPSIPENVVVFGSERANSSHYPLVMEQNRYLLWGFDESPEYMTAIGRELFINAVIFITNIDR